MSNNYFSFKQFTINQGRTSFKAGTDGVLLGAIADISGVRSILDIGAGTGLIALMLAQRSDAEIVAIEPDRDSFLQCRENMENSPWKERIKVEHTSLQNYSTSVKFDLIVSSIRRLILTLTEQRLKTNESFLTIEHGKRHDFTEEYINLTKDFYLKL
jgi:tRNA1Val (adenine37-N6)-methyltransferase